MDFSSTDRPSDWKRFIRLKSATTLAEPAVEALVDAAIALGETPLPATGGGYTVIRSISGKQRPRRKSK